MLYKPPKIDAIALALKINAITLDSPQNNPLKLWTDNDSIVDNKRLR